MIKPEELRIGNWVTNETGTIQLIGISKTKWETEKYLSKRIDILKPIPLTPEWLERFGFEYKDNMWYEDNQMIWMEEFKDGFDLIDPDNVTVITNRALKYVHQLQNLYYSLTGEEL